MMLRRLRTARTHVRRRQASVTRLVRTRIPLHVARPQRRDEHCHSAEAADASAPPDEDQGEGERTGRRTSGRRCGHDTALEAAGCCCDSAAQTSGRPQQQRMWEHCPPVTARLAQLQRMQWVPQRGRAMMRRGQLLRPARWRWCDLIGCAESDAAVTQLEGRGGCAMVAAGCALRRRLNERSGRCKQCGTARGGHSCIGFCWLEKLPLQLQRLRCGSRVPCGSHADSPTSEGAAGHIAADAGAGHAAAAAAAVP